uniref:Uncharacterized protein n=1 Tax=Rhizophagus irregularis (strain DAOM 181602 / DAOM 197198 / MUCL 43194) TaxID=747089 RepID=U9TGI2_RHIID
MFRWKYRKERLAKYEYVTHITCGKPATDSMDSMDEDYFLQIDDESDEYKILN